MRFRVLGSRALGIRVCKVQRCMIDGSRLTVECLPSTGFGVGHASTQGAVRMQKFISSFPGSP